MLLYDSRDKVAELPLSYITNIQPQKAIVNTL